MTYQAHDAPLGIAVAGCGYWGPKLVRNFTTAPATQVVALCDPDPERLHEASALCPFAAKADRLERVLGDASIAAVAVATPASTHAKVTRAALEAGKHVLVEKPLATNTAEAAALVDLAAAKGLTLMVDHTFVYSSPVRRMKELLDAGDLGPLYFMDSVRINLGLFQHDVNVLWDLAPHDLSIFDYLLERLPVSLMAVGSSHTESAMEDMAYLHLDYGDGLTASLHVNWLSPVKIRHLILGGSQKSLVYNDLDVSEPIKIYDRGIRVSDDKERHGLLIHYRSGDSWAPHVDRSEPLQNVVRHFARCIAESRRPLTDGAAGLRIVRLLEAAEESIRRHGARIEMAAR